MNDTIYDINIMRNIILESQHLRKKSSDSIEDNCLRHMRIAI